MLKIRLTRVGKRNSPIFRLVVAEKARAVKRQNIEILGLYNPGIKGNKFQANKERVLFWIGKGAQPSPTANNLLCDLGVLPKNQKVKTIFGKAQKKKEIKAEKESTTQTADTEKTQNKSKEIIQDGIAEAPVGDKDVKEDKEVAEDSDDKKVANVNQPVEKIENINNEETTQVDDTEEAQK